MAIYTVSQISEAIKKTLEGSFTSLQIRGEISNLKAQSSGHIYFTLKDENAQIGCALFRLDAARLKRALKEGDQVVALGSVSVFTQRGQYQLIVKTIEYQGVGDLLLRLEALKNKYKALGYFESARKKNLPPFPKVIGVVTSPTGAVIQDILHTFNKRHKGFKLLLCPVKVQGEGAANEIGAAIDFFNKHKLCDLMIVGRGGGSLEDLWAFNQEAVIQAIYASKIPIISAVGHETDFTLADFVADKRAPTPTAAAVMALADLNEVMSHIRNTSDAIFKQCLRKLSSEKRLLEQIKKRPELATPATLFQSYHFMLDRLKARLEPVFKTRFQRAKAMLDLKKSTLARLNPQITVNEKRVSLNHFCESLKQSVQKKIDQTEAKLTLLKEVLKSLNPEAVLDKGYALVYSEDGQKLYTRKVELEEKISLVMKDGVCHAKVL